MRTLYPLLFLLSCAFLFSQNTISVDAISVMQVCDDKHRDSDTRCATAPTVMNKVNPVYPEKARQSREEGTVILDLIVEKDGSPRDIHPISSPSELLSQSAINAVKQWRFSCGTYLGSAADVEMKVQVNFKLEAKPPLQLPGMPSPEMRGETGNLHNDGEEAYNREDYQTASNIYRRIIDQAPQDAGAWNMLGRSLLALNELDAAANAFSNSVRFYPASPVAYNNLGLVYWRQHKYEDAASEFREQIVVNPDDHYAHSNLGMMRRDERKCSDAMPALQKGLAITPNKADALIALGDCDIELGNRSKGLSELEQAVSSSSAPGTWNSAAYTLAERNIELNLAEKWSDTSLTMESARLQSISLDHLTAAQLNFAAWIAHYWDTRGWIYFLRGDATSAQSYLEASWRLYPGTEIGNHLAQVYEKAGRREEAIRTYAMAIAAADLDTRFKPREEDLSDAKQRLKSLEPNIAAAVERGRTDLPQVRVISVANSPKASGQADFVLRITSNKKIEAKWISGDTSLDPFAESLQTANLPIPIPQGVSVEIPQRGTLTCKSPTEACQFTVFRSDTSVDLARTEEGTTTRIAESRRKDPHIYDDPSMGMRISLPDEWNITKEERGSFSRPHNVMFGKTGSTAFFMLTREHVEATLIFTKKSWKRASLSNLNINGRAKKA